MDLHMNLKKNLIYNFDHDDIKIIWFLKIEKKISFI